MSERTTNILRIDASSRKNGSGTRELADELISTLQKQLTIGDVIIRDVAEGLPFVSEDWINANFTDETLRTSAQEKVLELSDQLITELEAADILVIGVPLYNFGIPASLKAWVDLIARARKTFRYTNNGPVGLLENKRAFLVVASGGTSVGSEIDFATGYMKHVLGFIGIHDVDVIAADRQMIIGEQALENARKQILDLKPAA